jgi:ABC-type transport system involved in multi-copper enzyme maturation permease subunit
MTQTIHRSAVPTRGDGFAATLRAEWTKFVSVRSTRLCLLLTAVLTVLMSVLLSIAGGTDANDGPRYTDAFSFVYQPMTGDGTITARVASQQPSQEWAKAGVIVKAGTGSGAPYAAVLVTPRHGVRMEDRFTTEIPVGTGYRWLRLTRTGTTVTGYVSADGVAWRRAGTATLDGLPATAEVGLFVTSPPRLTSAAIPGGYETHAVTTTGQATFDNVTLSPAGGQAARAWSHTDVSPGAGAKDPLGTQVAGGFTDRGGSLTVTGSGDISGYGIASFQGGGDDDVVVNSLVGVAVGLIVVITLGVIFAGAEYKTGIVRTTFAASPRRGRVLAAKAVVLGSAVFVVGLVTSVAAFLLSQPGQHRHGFNAPAYPHPSLLSAPVLRAVAGTALVLAVLAVFSLAVGTLLRRPVRALVLLLSLVIVPQLVGTAALSLGAQQWINRVTPVAGLAIQHTRPRFDVAISPWLGFAVLCGYAVVATVAALVTVRRRDA